MEQKGPRFNNQQFQLVGKPLNKTHTYTRTHTLIKQVWNVPFQKCKAFSVTNIKRKTVTN